MKETPLSGSPETPMSAATPALPEATGSSDELGSHDSFPPTPPGTPDAVAPSAPPPRARKPWWRRVLRAVGGLLGFVLFVLLILAATLAWVVHTENGTRFAWTAAERLLKPRLTGTLDGGTLQNGVRLRNVVWRDGGTVVSVDRVAGRWALSKAPWRFTVDYLRVGTLDVRMKPSAPSAPSGTPTLPHSLVSPLQFALREVRANKISVHSGTTTTNITALALHGSTDGRHHQLVLEHVTTPYGRLQARVALDGARPFATSGDVRFAGNVSEQPFNVAATVTGTLENLIADVNASGIKLAAQAHVEATPFASVMLKQISLTADHVNPQVLSAGAPAADLSIRALLRPVSAAAAATESDALQSASATQIVGASAAPGTAKVVGVAAASTPSTVAIDSSSASAAPPAAAAGSALFTVAGPVSIVNARPGSLDAKLLPLIDAKAFVRLDAHQQVIQNLSIRLLNAATLTGSGSLAHGKGHFQMQAAKLDLHALHDALRPTQLTGRIDVDLDGNTQSVSAQLTDASAAISLVAKIRATPLQTVFDPVQLSIGPGRAQLTGVLKRNANASFAFKGDVHDFDPLALLSHQAASKPAEAGVHATRAAAAETGAAAGAGQNINARVTGTFDATGTLGPVVRAKAAFTLRDSVYDGLPLTGFGTVQVAGTRLLPSQAQLSIAGNDVGLSGGFGAPGDRLQFKINAPQLDRLGFGLAGQVIASGNVTGSLTHPDVTAQYQANGLVFGNARVGHATGDAELHDGANGALNISINAKDVTAPGLDLSNLVGRIAGTRASHTINLTAQGDLHGNRVNALIAAQGALTNNSGGMGWRGTISQLRNTGMPALTLGAPVTVIAEPKHIEVGATHLTLEGSVLDLRNIVYQNGQLRTAGKITGIDVARMAAFQSEMTGKPSGLVTDLVLDGDWDLSVGSAASGYFALRRRSGDVQVNAGQGRSDLGLDKLAARVDFSNAGTVNQARLHVETQAARVGFLNADIRATLVHAEDGGALTINNDSALSGSITGEVPSLRTTGGLLGPAYLLDGMLDLKLAVAGTVGKPDLSGTLSGNKLSAASLDQGVQLNDGVIDIVIAKNVVNFRNVVFHGGPGTLSAVGKVDLDVDDPNVTAKIVADKLELFGAPDRQLSVSGAATMANGGPGGGLAINGKFVVDHALFDLPSSSAPKLGDDVVIVRSDGRTTISATPKHMAGAEKPVGPFAPHGDITIDLGQKFRFRGAGADLGLVGALTVTSTPNAPLSAVGNINVTNGSTYEAFGRKLTIETGFFTFNGPIDNPSLNLLAMRRNQEVEAGVRVRGTLRAPDVQLVSEPSVQDDEKLSWLLFGHGTDTGSNLGQENTMAAALALVGSAGGKRIAQTVGLDEFTIGTSDSGLTDAQVVSVAKALNEHFVLGYEQGLQSAGYLFKLTWLLSRRWSVAAQAGTFNGLFLLFTERYD